MLMDGPEGEFARAYATRKGMKNPELFAEWAVSHGDVSWNIYGSEVPFEFTPVFGMAMRMIENKVPPILGEDMFRYFPTFDHFDRALAVCDHNVEIAHELDDPSVLLETLVVRDYISLTRELYTITKLTFHQEASDKFSRDEVESSFKRIEEARLGIHDSLLRWEALFGEDAGGGRLSNTLKMTDDIVLLLKEQIY